MVDPNDRDRVGPAPRRNWLVWAVGAAVLLLVLILALRGCDDADDADDAVGGDAAALATPDPFSPPAATLGATGPATAPTGDVAFMAEEMRGYLQGTDAAGAAGRTFGLDQVTFDTGSARLDGPDIAVIGQVAAVLTQFPNATVTITGYADPEGDAAANKKLAAQRAVAVKQALATAGLPPARLLTNVVGETGGAAIPQNRRVELLVKR